MEKKDVQARIIALYLPQFHPVAENDIWWKKGFTEWMNVGKARQLYPSHYQPKVPADLGYYDLRVAETRKAQADMAREYGVEGFCYWHYWFGNGRRLLERPFNEVLASGEPDFPFCLAWANESWRGFSHGMKNKETLIDQLYPGEADEIAHFNAVLPAFKDKRYIQVDGKPLFMVYQPFDHPRVQEFMTLWRRLAVENGLKGIWFVGQTGDVDKSGEKILRMGFDAVNAVRLFDCEWRGPKLKRRWCRLKHELFGWPRILKYKTAAKLFVEDMEYNTSVIPTIIPNWDHSPRSGKRGLVLEDARPEYFKKHVEDVMEHLKEKPAEHRIAFIKSWNEWGEGNYMEPDLKYGRGYLEALRDCVVKK